MRRFLAGGLLAVAGLLAAPALAADHTITAGPQPLMYAQTDITIDQGDTITFSNMDSSGARHDVTAKKLGSDGKPIFKSETILPGKTSAVAGVEFLTTGDYAFYCTVHPSFMNGTIHVTANGTPQQRTVDTTPPDATVSILDSRIKPVLKHKALRVKLTSNEPSRFKLAATSGRTTIAKGTATTTDGSRTAALTLTTAGRKLLAKSRSVTVRLRASVNDAAGNRSAASATRKLRR